MFRVEFFVDDKKLGDALTALIGLARGQPQVSPVTNVEHGSNGTVRQSTSGRLIDMFAAHLRKSKVKQLDAKYVKGWMRDEGLNVASHGYVLKLAQLDGIIRRTGRNKTAHTPIYTVVK